MEHGEEAAAVTGVRDFAAAGQLDYGGQQEPEKLRQRESNDRENAAEVASAGQRDESPAAGSNKKERQRGSRGQSEVRGETQRKDQRIAGRAGVEAQHQQDIRGDES